MFVFIVMFFKNMAYSHNKSRLITNTIFLYEVIGIAYINLFLLFSNNYLKIFKSVIKFGH